MADVNRSSRSQHDELWQELESAVPAGMRSRLSLVLRRNRQGLGRVKSGNPAAISITPPVFIAAGTSSQLSVEDTIQLTGILKRYLTGFSGTVISGGTRSGLPGLVGMVHDEDRSSPFTLIGYLPEKLPEHAEADNAHYDLLIRTKGNGFSVLEPLQYWTNLLAGGIEPADVHLLGFGGGAISRFEYLLALALGAEVMLCPESGRAAMEICRDKRWRELNNLIRVL